MLVYGDHSECVDPRARLKALRADAGALAERSPGLDRHAALVGLFIDLAALLQGIADADFAALGEDCRTPATDALMAQLVDLARAVRCSWESSFADLPKLPELSAPPLPREVELKLPEGYAFYALYPEAYLEAAGRLLPYPSPPGEGDHAKHGGGGSATAAEMRAEAPFSASRSPSPDGEGSEIVIGIRSIGTGLAALAAAALGAPPPSTVRPTGHPFTRELRVGPDLAADLIRDPAARYIIVDEGPGLSGSSFGAVADFLEAHGVDRSRIAFLPSHAGDLGPQASDAHRARWTAAPRPVVSMDALLLPDRLASWVETLVGPLTAPLEDVSGGAWRARFYADELDWPAVAPNWERRKFLAHAADGPWLVKFAGLGRTGAARLAVARSLHAAGFSPEPRGLVHGFLVERWHSDARPLEPGEPLSTEVERVAAYLSLRSCLFPASDGSGASLETLLKMARYNAAQLLGDRRAAALDHWRPRLGDLAPRVHRVRTDNRLDAHEWLRLPDGRLLKADALDHSAAHDLIGCQSIEWDVAGAATELGLSIVPLAAQVAGACGRPVDAELLAFLTPCYLAFRLGAHRMTADGLAHWPAEAARNAAAADRYAARLDAQLDGKALV